MVIRVCSVYTVCCVIEIRPNVWNVNWNKCAWNMFASPYGYEAHTHNDLIMSVLSSSSFKLTANNYTTKLLHELAANKNEKKKKIFSAKNADQNIDKNGR